MQAIILAAGQGSRLRPLTNDKPKCMVELGGVTLLERQIEVMRKMGITKIVVVGGYCAEKLINDNVEVVINPRYDKTNMVSTLFCSIGHLDHKQDLVVSYGDIVYQESVLKSLMASNANLAVTVDRQWRRLWELRMEDPLKDAETLKVIEEDKIVELGKKPVSFSDIQGQYIGLYKVRADQLSKFTDFWKLLDREAFYDGKDFDNMYMTSYLQCLIDMGWDARAVFTDNGWLEIDTVDDYNLYNDLILSKKLAPFFTFD